LLNAKRAGIPSVNSCLGRPWGSRGGGPAWIDDVTRRALGTVMAALRLTEREMELLARFYA
jgi:hypothetical protein